MHIYKYVFVKGSGFPSGYYTLDEVLDKVYKVYGKKHYISGDKKQVVVDRDVVAVRV